MVSLILFVFFLSFSPYRSSGFSLPPISTIRHKNTITICAFAISGKDKTGFQTVSVPFFRLLPLSSRKNTRWGLKGNIFPSPLPKFNLALRTSKSTMFPCLLLLFCSTLIHPASALTFSGGGGATRSSLDDVFNILAHIPWGGENEAEGGTERLNLRPIIGILAEV